MCREARIKHQDLDDVYQTQVLDHPRWSGSLIPRFDYDTAIHVVNVLNAADFALNPDGGFRLTWEGDCIRLYEMEQARTDPGYRGDLIFPDREGRYMIGLTWCCWIEDTSDDQ